MDLSEARESMILPISISTHYSLININKKRYPDRSLMKNGNEMILVAKDTQVVMSILTEKNDRPRRQK